MNTRKPGIGEIIEQACKLKGEDMKIAWLRQNDSQALRDILHLTFDVRVTWSLPHGDVPYKPTDQLDQEGMLYRESKKMHYYLDGLMPGLKQLKRETMYIQLLEAVAPKDAVLLVSIKDKKLPWRGLKPETILKAFPGLFVAPVTK
jgi:hypothetical protein